MAKAKEAKPRRLGRGLSSLIGDPVKVSDLESDAAAPATATAPAAPIEPTTPAPGAPVGGVPRGTSETTAPGDAIDRRLQIIDINDIEPNPNQPRRSMDDGGLEQLARSIGETGMMQPIVLRAGAGDSPWEIVAGERRWRAARLAGLTRVPAVTVEISERESAEWAVVENLQREDLNPMDRAFAFQKLADDFGATHGEIAEKIGIDRSTVANLVRLTTLEAPVQELVASGELSTGHAKAILSLPAGRERAKVASDAAKGGWSVRSLEQRCKLIVGGGVDLTPVPSEEEQAAQSRRIAARADLEIKLSEHLGTPVEVRTDQSGKKGRLIVKFFDLEQLDGVFDRMGFGGE